MIMDPDLELEAARAVVARPDFHSRKGILRACAVLDRAGDWMDRERSRHLRRAVEDEPRIRLEDAISMMALFALLIVGLWVGAGLGLDAGADQLTGAR